MTTLAARADRRALWWALGLIALGGALEIVQGMTGRDADIFDELANALGVLAGLGIGWAIIAILKARRIVEDDAPAAIPSAQQVPRRQRAVTIRAAGTGGPPMFKEFRTFVMRGSVIDLAVGVVVGAAFTAIVNSLVKDVINTADRPDPGRHRFFQLLSSCSRATTRWRRSRPRPMPAT